MIRGPAVAIAAVKAQLETALAAEIDTINTAATDSYLLDYITAVRDYVPVVDELTEWPSLALDEGRLSWENDTGYEATGVADLIIVMYVADDEMQALAYKLRRLRLAVMRTVLPTSRRIGDGSAGSIWGLQFQGADPGPMLGGNHWKGEEPPAAFATWSTVRLRCKYDEA